MYVYTVYGVPGVGRVSPSKRVSAVSRAKAAARVDRSPSADYGNTVLYAAQPAESINSGETGFSQTKDFRIAREPAVKHGTDHLYLENMQSLLDLRYPQAVQIDPDYIRQYITRLNRRSCSLTN